MRSVHQEEVSTARVLLDYSVVIMLLAGMFFWSTDLYMAFWLRRFFVLSAGLLSLIYVLIYQRTIVHRFFKQKLALLVVLLSGITLLATSPFKSALFGNPLVHPSVLTLLSSVSVGLYLASKDTTKLLRATYYSILVWAICNFVFWLRDTSATARLGFLDSQVIYAACLFSIGVLLGLWRYKHEQEHRRWLVASVLFLLVCLILSQTRSAIVITVVVTCGLFWKELWRHKKAVVGAVVVCFICVIAAGSYFSRLHNYRYLKQSVDYRLHLIQASLPEKDSRILSGSGIGSIDTNIQRHGARYNDLAPDIKDGIRFESSHNYFADLLVERGLIIMAMYLILLVAACRRKPSKKNVVVRAVLVLLVVFLFVNNINIQMELALWVCILLLIFGQSTQMTNKKA